VKLGHVQHPSPSLFGQGGADLLKVRKTKTAALQVSLSETFFRTEPFYEAFSIGRLVLAVVETE